MVYYTGDTHGKFDKILAFIRINELTADDTIVILGDAGFNYYGNHRGDAEKKAYLSKFSPRILCVHGNHEKRPATIETYKTKRVFGGTVWYEPQYPNILFAKDGEVYDLDGKKSIVIGGAYSVDKYYRISHGHRWFKDEQPSPRIKARVEQVLEKNKWRVDQVLTHTCPAKYVPHEAFLSCIDQSTVDTSTEDWLDTIEDRLTYGRWLCGHWHIDKTVDKLRFVMHDVII